MKGCLVPMTCCVCQTITMIHPYHIGRRTTCAKPKCISERKRRQAHNRSPEIRHQLSEAAKRNSLGGLNSYHGTEKHRQVARRNFTGPRNPRWAGGLTRAESYRKWKQKNKDRCRFYYRNRQFRLRTHGNHTFDEWKALKLKYGSRCLSCHRQEPEITLTQDYVVPISKGGSNDISNIQPLCLKCNMEKYTQTIDYRPAEVVVQ